MQRFKVQEIELYKDSGFAGMTVVFIYIDEMYGGTQYMKCHLSDYQIQGYGSASAVVQVAAKQATEKIGDPRFYEACREYVVNNGYKFNDPMYSYEYGAKQKALKHMEMMKKYQAPTISAKDMHMHINYDGTVDFHKVQKLFEKIDKPATPFDDEGPNMHEIDSLPGIMQKVKHPETGAMTRIKDIIISLNDQHGWSRERVADWLESLDVDLRFQTGGGTLSSEQKAAYEDEIKTLMEKIELFEVSIANAQKRVKQLKELLKTPKEET